MQSTMAELSGSLQDGTWAYLGADNTSCSLVGVFAIAGAAALVICGVWIIGTNVAILGVEWLFKLIPDRDVVMFLVLLFLAIRFSQMIHWTQWTVGDGRQIEPMLGHRRLCSFLGKPDEVKGAHRVWACIKMLCCSLLVGVKLMAFVLPVIYLLLFLAVQYLPGCMDLVMFVFITSTAWVLTSDKTWIAKDSRAAEAQALGATAPIKLKSTSTNQDKC